MMQMQMLAESEIDLQRVVNEFYSVLAAIPGFAWVPTEIDEEEFVHVMSVCLSV